MQELARRVPGLWAQLADKELALAKRFRVLFALKNIGGMDAIEAIGAVLMHAGEGALLKHECAYCLGQMQDPQANKVLESVLRNKDENPMVRHEAAEAMAAIGDEAILGLLEEYTKDESVYVAETCEIAVDKMKRHMEGDSNEMSKFNSVDPAKPCASASVADLEERLMDESLTLYSRYEAMFTLRNMKTNESVLALTKGFEAESALFRHEIAFVLGQIASPVAIDALHEGLKRGGEASMVRHECAEALGSIATDQCIAILKEFANDADVCVRDSCIVALDMAAYENNSEFQYTA